MKTKHNEHHLSHRNNWLRAGVLGANDGLISTASLLTGMVAAKPDFHTLLLAGASALVAGAISMAAGEYVSVSSQADTEKADMKMEKRELALHAEEELQELATIYQERGLTPELAQEVAKQLTGHNALDAHMRDEIGISEETFANPLQAAFSSAVAFIVGAAIPMLVILLLPLNMLWTALIVSTLIGLAGLGYLSAKLGGAPARPAMMRVVIWGCVAMGVTTLIGKLVGIAV
ncbi:MULTISPECIES: VIT family protein [Neisseria]|nr:MULTISPECIES: VIT family protein [Neisseria]